MYKSTDGGETWKFAGLYNAGQIGAVRIHPTNPDIVWVAAGGDIFKPNEERGVFKTTDGGQTWRKLLYVSDQVGAMDVELQPGNPNVVYAWMSRLERKPWTIISGSREGGFYKSTDGGATWQRVLHVSDDTGITNVVMDPSNPDVLYAAAYQRRRRVGQLIAGGPEAGGRRALWGRWARRFPPKPGACRQAKSA